MRPKQAKSWRGDLTENPHADRDYTAIAVAMQARWADYPDLCQQVLVSMEPGEVGCVAGKGAPAYAWDLYSVEMPRDGERWHGSRRVGQFIEGSRSRGLIVLEHERHLVVQMLPERFTHAQGTKRIKEFNLA